MITVKELENIRDRVKHYPANYYDGRDFSHLLGKNFVNSIYLAYVLIAYFKLSDEEVISMTFEEGLTYIHLFDWK